MSSRNPSVDIALPDSRPEAHITSAPDNRVPRGYAQVDAAASYGLQGNNANRGDRPQVPLPSSNYPADTASLNHARIALFHDQRVLPSYAQVATDGSHGLPLNQSQDDLMAQYWRNAQALPRSTQTAAYTAEPTQHADLPSSRLHFFPDNPRPTTHYPTTPCST